MAVEDRHPHRGNCNSDGVVAENLAGFVDHLHLFLGIAVIQEVIDLRQTVESDLMRINLGVRRATVEQFTGLNAQLVNGVATGTRHRLIGGDHHPLQGSSIVQGLKSHHHLNSRAVRVGDNTLFVVLGNILRIDLGHHQRHLGIHTPSAGIIHTDRSGRSGDGAELLTARSAGTEQGDIDPFEGVLVQKLHHVLLAVELQKLADGPFGCQQTQLLDRKLAFSQHFQHLLADGAGGADDRDIALFSHGVTSFI